MNSDLRIRTSYFTHPKILRLGARLGDAGVVAHLRLLAWVATHRPDGALNGLTDHELEAACGGRGKRGALASELVALVLLDGETGARAVHNWLKHNAWAAQAPDRELKARWNAYKKHHGEAEADRLVPEYAVLRKRPKDATSDASSRPPAGAASSAPSPSPAPEACIEEQKIPPSAAPESAKEFLWRTGKDFLVSTGIKVERAGSLVGQLIRDLGDVQAAEVMRAAIAEGTQDPAPYLKAASLARSTRPKVVPINAPIAGKNFGDGASDGEIERFFSHA